MNGWPQSGQSPSSPPEWGELDVPSGWSGYFPCIAVDALGNAAITFNVSGPDKHVSMWQAFKCAADNQFQAPFEVKPGLAAYDVGIGNVNWGDYSGASPDPIAPAIFWGHAQIPDGTGTTTLWKTWVSRHVLDCGLDVDGDGFVTALDFGAYIGLYTPGSPAADYKGDGQLNLEDVSAIQTDLGGP